MQWAADGGTWTTYLSMEMMRIFVSLAIIGAKKAKPNRWISSDITPSRTTVREMLLRFFSYWTQRIMCTYSTVIPNWWFISQPICLMRWQMARENPRLFSFEPNNKHGTKKYIPKTYLSLYSHIFCVDAWLGFYMHYMERAWATA